MAKATQTKGRTSPQAEFEIPLAEALDLLLKARHIIPGALWYMSVRGDTLCITREDPPAPTPIDNT